MSAPFSRTLEASTRLAEGLTVLMSIRTLPPLNPARNPSGPSETDFKASVLATITKVTSAAAETARGESPHFMPRSTSHFAFERVVNATTERWNQTRTKQRDSPLLRPGRGENPNPPQ